MKSKKGLRIIAALVGIISVFTSFGFVAAFADDETPVTTKEYVLENASVDELAGVAVPFDYLKVKTGSNDILTITRKTRLLITNPTPWLPTIQSLRNIRLPFR